MDCNAVVVEDLHADFIYEHEEDGKEGAKSAGVRDDAGIVSSLK